MTTYLNSDPLSKAWTALLQQSSLLGLPSAAFNDPRSPVAPLLAEYDAWDKRWLQTFEGKPLTVSDLEVWTTRLQAQQTVLAQLLVRFPPGAPPAAPRKPAVALGPVDVSGALPWWYWPVRIAAGVGAGYIVYRIVSDYESTTASPSRAPQFGAIEDEAGW